MNTIRKIKKNTKALSPVVASIILIAVTVAVSIAVAAWMGALVIGQMNTEEVKITSVTFSVADQTIVIKASNTGTAAVTIDSVWVNNVDLAGNWTSSTTADTIEANGAITITIDPYTDLANGDSYQIKLVSAAGNTFPYTASAPN